MSVEFKTRGPYTEFYHRAPNELDRYYVFYNYKKDEIFDVWIDKFNIIINGVECAMDPIEVIEYVDSICLGEL